VPGEEGKKKPSTTANSSTDGELPAGGHGPEEKERLSVRKGKEGRDLGSGRAQMGGEKTRRGGDVNAGQSGGKVEGGSHLDTSLVPLGGGGKKVWSTRKCIDQRGAKEKLPKQAMGIERRRHHKKRERGITHMGKGFRKKLGVKGTWNTIFAHGITASPGKPGGRV